MEPQYKIGQRIQFMLEPTIKAVVTAIYLYGDRVLYECSYWNGGENKTSAFATCEIEPIDTRRPGFKGNADGG